MLALSLSEKFCCFGIFVFVFNFFVFVFNRFLFFRFSFHHFFVLVLVCVNEFVIFSFFTIFVFVFVNENHTASRLITSSKPFHPPRYLPSCTSDLALADTMRIYKFHLLTDNRYQTYRASICSLPSSSFVDCPQV